MSGVVSARRLSAIRTSAVADAAAGGDGGQQWIQERCLSWIQERCVEWVQERICAV